MPVTVARVHLGDYFSIQSSDTLNNVLLSAKEADWLCDNIPKLNKINYAMRRIAYMEQAVIIERVEIDKNEYAYGVSDEFNSVYVSVEDMDAILTQLRVWLTELKLLEALSVVGNVESDD